MKYSGIKKVARAAVSAVTGLAFVITSFAAPFTYGLNLQTAIAATTVFSENFGVGADVAVSTLQSWEQHESATVAKDPDVSGEDSASSNGGRFAKIASDSADNGPQDGYICHEIDFSDYENLTLDYLWQGDPDAEEDDDYGVVQIRNNGGGDGNCGANGGWTEINEHDLYDYTEGSWHSETGIDISAFDGTVVLIRFINNAKADDEFFRVDAINIEGDLVEGEGEPTTGTVVVEKIVVGYDGDILFDFDASWIDGDNNFDMGAGTTTLLEVPTGTGLFVEELAAGEGWTLTSAICDSDLTDEDDALDPADFDLAEGETITCTFVNTYEEDEEEVDECVEGEQWLATIEDEDQGTRKDGSAVLTERSNSDAVLGEDDDVFFSLGVEGSVVGKFNAFVENVDGDDITVYERTGGNPLTYGEETALVEVSQDGSTWYSVGTASSHATDGATSFDFDATGLEWIMFVRVTDTTDFDTEFPSDNGADGFDLDAVGAVNGVCDEPEEDVEPALEITTPATDGLVFAPGVINLAALYTGDENTDDTDVKWAVRFGTCDAGVDTVAGNVDGHSDPSTYNGDGEFEAAPDLSGEPEGEYCFVVNPQEHGLRETRTFFLEEPRDFCIEEDGVEVFAKENSLNGGIGLATGVNVDTGDILVVEQVDELDTWIAGAGATREGDADGLPAFSNYEQDGFSFPHGSLVGQIGGGDYFLIGTDFEQTMTEAGELVLFYWDSNNHDNSDSITFDIAVECDDEDDDGGNGPDDRAPQCQGIDATVYVDGFGFIVGGPDNGSVYAGTLRGTGGDDVIVGTNDVDIILAGNGDDLVCALDKNDEVYGQGGNDEIYGNKGADLLVGGLDNDLIFGGRGNDEIRGGEGDDELYGDRGDDLVYGADGRDLLYGGNGNDDLYGGNHADELYGEGDNDELYGGDGPDIMRGAGGNDVLVGGNGDDDMNGNQGDDELRGGDGEDYMRGGKQNDLMIGGNHNDFVCGDEGEDDLRGNDGDDVLCGKEGNDILHGGNGDDKLDGGDDVDELRGQNDTDTCINGETTLTCEVFVSDESFCEPATTGSIVIVKDASPVDEEDDWEFVFNVSFDELFEIVEVYGEGVSTSSETLLELEPGTYNVSEILEFDDKWMMTDLVCESSFDEDETEVNLEERTASVDLQAGEVVTCTFTNVEYEECFIEGYKYDYETEEGLAGWTIGYYGEVYNYGEEGPEYLYVSGETETDEDGYYCLFLDEPVNYGVSEESEFEVYEVLQNGWSAMEIVVDGEDTYPYIDSDEGEFYAYTYVEYDGETITVDFYNDEVGCLVEGYKYDASGNPIENWEIGMEGYGYYEGWYDDEEGPVLEGDNGEYFYAYDYTDENGYYCLTPYFEHEDLKLAQVLVEDLGDWTWDVAVFEYLKRGWDIFKVEVDGEEADYESYGSRVATHLEDIDMEETYEVDFYNTSACLVEGYKFDERGNPLSGWNIGLAGTLYNEYYPAVQILDEEEYDQFEGFEVIGTDVTDEDGYYCILDDNGLVADYFDDEEEDELYEVEIRGFGPLFGEFIVYEEMQDGWSIDHVDLFGENTDYYFDDVYDVYTYIYSLGGYSDWFSLLDQELEEDEGIFIPRVDFFNTQDEDEQPTPTNSNGRRGGNTVGGGSGPSGQVLGASTDACPMMWIEDFMAMGRNNDTMEVYKLQLFLNLFGFEVELTGVYDQATFDAVSAFQAAYGTEVLNPWANQFSVVDNSPSGMVYLSTRWKINDLLCPGMTPFPQLILLNQNPNF